MLIENLKTALEALYGNRLRTLLTLLGVVIGVFAVTTTVSLGQIATAGITGEIQAFGAQSLFVIPVSDHPEGVPFTDADVESLGRLPIEILRQRNTRVWATAGDERVTAQRGVVAAVVPLAARRGAAEAPFRGSVYVLDCTTNNPGSPGGGVIDARGRLLGMLGKELRSTEAGIWLNYALPADELAAGREAILGGTAVAAAKVEVDPFDPRLLGVILVPDLLDRTPPFVETVEVGSAAARAGLEPDDLVIAVGSRTVTTRAGVEEALGTLAEGDPVTLAVIRAGRIVELDLGPRPRGDRR